MLHGHRTAGLVIAFSIAVAVGGCGRSAVGPEPAGGDSGGERDGARIDTGTTGDAQIDTDESDTNFGGDAGPGGDAESRTIVRCATASFRRRDVDPPDPGPVAYEIEFEENGDAWAARAEFGGLYPHGRTEETKEGEPEPLRTWELGNQTGAFGPETVSVEADGFVVDAQGTDIPGVFRGTVQVPERPKLEARELEARCWREGFEPTYSYDPESGTCVDGNGDEGLNDLGLITVRETGRGECTDLTGVFLNENDLGYPQLTNWNLRGADLRRSELRFADLVDADLEGTDLREIGYGYATISGSVDEYTQLPETGSCETSEGAVTCGR